MPLVNILVLCGIVGAFAIFAAALTYANYQSGRAMRAQDQAPAPSTEEREWLKAA